MRDDELVEERRARGSVEQRRGERNDQLGRVRGGGVGAGGRELEEWEVNVRVVRRGSGCRGEVQLACDLSRRSREDRRGCSQVVGYFSAETGAAADVEATGAASVATVSGAGVGTSTVVARVRAGPAKEQAKGYKNQNTPVSSTMASQLASSSASVD